MLEGTPARMERVESQIVQLRAEMRDEFSAVRQEIRETNERTTTGLREEIREANERTVATLGEAVDAARREARILFEEVIGSIATLDEGRGGRGRGRKPPT